MSFISIGIKKPLSYQRHRTQFGPQNWFGPTQNGSRAWVTGLKGISTMATFDCIFLVLSLNIHQSCRDLKTQKLSFAEKYVRQKDSGSQSQITSSCNYPISFLLVNCQSKLQTRSQGLARSLLRTAHRRLLELNCSCLRYGQGDMFPMCFIYSKEDHRSTPHFLIVQ